MMAKQKTILLVEDEKPIQEIIKRKLELNGFYVVAARSVKEALACFRKSKRIDLIWLDHYLLGKESGIDLLTKLKNRNFLRKIPVFLVSNTAGPEKIEEYMRLGIKKYYLKADHSLDEIVSDIKKYLI